MRQTMKCKRPKGCQAIAKSTKQKCKRCVGPKGVGGKGTSYCTACYQHRAMECESKNAKRAAAQNKAYKQLGTSSSYRGAGSMANR